MSKGDGWRLKLCLFCFSGSDVIVLAEPLILAADHRLVSRTATPMR